MFSEFQRKTIVEYHQLPLWNPYHAGGVPNIAFHFISFLYPFFIFNFFLGSVIGFKINLAIHLFLGLIGMFLLSRYLKMNTLPAVLSSSIFILNSIIPLHFTSGHPWILSIAYIPWVFLNFLKLLDKKHFKYILWIAILLNLIFLQEGFYIFFYVSLFLLIYFLLNFNKYGTLNITKKIFYIYSLTFLIGAIIFIPTIDLSFRYSRHTIEYSGYSLTALCHSLLDRDQNYYTERELGPFYNGIIGEKGKHPFIIGISHGWNEYGVYIGLIPLILFLIGIPLLWRKYWRLVISSIIFLWLAFGDRVQFSLWRFIHQFPIFNQLRASSRFIIIFIFCLAIIDGLTMQKLYQLFHKKTKHKKTIKIIASLIIFFVAFDLIIVNGQVLNDAFIIPPLDIKPHKEFYQTSIHYKYSNLTTMYDYPNFLRNEGKVNAYIEIPTKIYAVPRESEGYKGEVYLQNTKGEASYAYWSPNKLIVNVNVSDEGYVVVNQNYDKGWKTKNNRKVESFNGLISTKVYPEDRQITFYYLPNSFILGIVISFLTLIGIIVYMMNKGKRRIRIINKKYLYGSSRVLI